MAARGSVVRRREKHEIVMEARTSLSENGDDHCGPPPQLSQSYRDRDRRASCTPLFHDFDMESDDTDPDDLHVLAPVAEYVAPARVVACDEQVSVIEYTTPGPDVTFTCDARRTHS